MPGVQSRIVEALGCCTCRLCSECLTLFQQPCDEVNTFRMSPGSIRRVSTVLGKDCARFLPLVEFVVALNRAEAKLESDALSPKQVRALAASATSLHAAVRARGDIWVGYERTLFERMFARLLEVPNTSSAKLTAIPKPRRSELFNQAAKVMAEHDELPPRMSPSQFLLTLELLAESVRRLEHRRGRPRKAAERTFAWQLATVASQAGVQLRKGEGKSNALRVLLVEAFDEAEIARPVSVFSLIKFAVDNHRRVVDLHDHKAPPTANCAFIATLGVMYSKCSEGPLAARTRPLRKSGRKLR